MSGTILVISGPSGSGKSSIIKELVKDIGPYYFSISTTTRPKREGEEDGKDYYFVTHEEFLEDIEAGYFLEYAAVHGNFYGTSLRPVEQALKEGKLVIFDIDVQGHASIREKLAEITTSVFLTTPSLKVLQERLHSRNTDENDVIVKRLIMAKDEIKRIDEFDYVVINDTFETALSEMAIIAKSAKLKRTDAAIKTIVDAWD